MKNFQRATLACSASIIAALCVIAPASAATVNNSPQLERVSEQAAILPQLSSPTITASATASIAFERPAVSAIAAPPPPPPVVEAPAPEAAPQNEAVAPQAAYAAAPAPVAARAVQAPVVAPAAPAVAYAPVAVSASGKGAAIVAAALSQLGVNQDCTALVSNSLRAVGINFHSAPAGYLSLGTVVSASQAQPGDLIYYSNAGEGMPHIAVYIGGGKAVHGGWNGYTTAIASAYLGSGPTFIHVA